MSGPKSLQRASPTCCQNNRTCCHYHYYHHHHHHHNHHHHQVHKTHQNHHQNHNHPDKNHHHHPPHRHRHQCRYSRHCHLLHRRVAVPPKYGHVSENDEYQDEGIENEEESFPVSSNDEKSLEPYCPETRLIINNRDSETYREKNTIEVNNNININNIIDNYDNCININNNNDDIDNIDINDNINDKTCNIEITKEREVEVKKEEEQVKVGKVLKNLKILDFEELRGGLWSEERLIVNDVNLGERNQVIRSRGGKDENWISWRFDIFDGENGRRRTRTRRRTRARTRTRNTWTTKTISKSTTTTTTSGTRRASARSGYNTCRGYNGAGKTHRGIATNFFLLATAGAFLALAIVAPPVSGTSSEKDDEAMRPRMGGMGGTGTALASSPPNVRAERVPVVDTRTAGGTFSGAQITGSIDLLAALQLYNTTKNGVTQVPGLARLRPAYYLQGEERDLRLNEASFERAAALLRRVPEFTVAAALRQEEANSGTIVAFSHGNNRYLELQSSGRKDELRLHYVSRRDGSVHVEAFPFRLADGAWHRLALSISGSQVELLVDCHPLYRRLLRPGPPDTNFTLPQLQLWVGQRNAKHFLFKGALQDVKLIPGAHGYLSQCPQLDSSCPTCGQFSILQNTVEQLMHNLNDLTRRLAAAEGRISKVEECECQKSCRANGTVHEDGATWEKGCEQCSCVHGDIECRPTPCAPVTCKNPVIPSGQCCPVCLKQCYLRGVIYDHGEKVSPKQCVECDCFDGSFTCQRFDTETRCPPLPCPASEQISVAEECCKFCPGVDYCAKGHECHVNASCLNLQTTYACHCNIGFQGDGHKCHDVDECKQQGGSDGHHCNANTRCVNVVGGYTCECLPGYHRIDKFNCAELDECVTSRHSCSEHAACVNTAGSYYCVCSPGYAGDGHLCKPVCEQSCQNGGECISPGRCSCRRGYIGNSCELDLDECASDLHRCHHSSTCFNMPGWYYCRCKPGYRSALHESNQGTQCVDIDECSDLTTERRHTCHPSARCINTEGGYECSCHHHQDEVQQQQQRNSGISADLADDSSSSSNECRLSCWYEDREIPNGDSFAPTGNPCRVCSCKDGVVSCREPVCDCSAPGSRRDKCCPQCDPAASCRHQELHHLVFRSGERWIYQCQTCECLYGEIDCWQMECPPVTCSNPVTEDGDCCPRCEDDPCARESSISPTTAGSPVGGNTSAILSPAGHPQPCSYAGFLHESGSSWQDLHDKCTTCECKDGQLCCSYDYRCVGDMDDSRDPPVIPIKPRSTAVSSNANTVQQNIVDTSKGALSTSPSSKKFPSMDESPQAEAGSTPSNPGISGIPRSRWFTQGHPRSSGVPRLLASSTTVQGLPGSKDTSETVATSNEADQHRFDIDNGSDNGSNIKKSRLENAGEQLSKDSNNEKFPTTIGPFPSLGAAIHAGDTSETPGTTAATTTTQLSASASTQASQKKASSLGRSGSLPVGKSFNAFKTLQNAMRYSAGSLKEQRITSFSTDRRRRPAERGPRLINGNPSGKGHDAT